MAAAGLVLSAAGVAGAQQGSGRPVALDADGARVERVKKLVAQMTVEEKAAQMQNHAPAIARLGIPAYDYWNEGLHGSARSGYSTMFPQAIGLAAMWDTELMHAVATTIGVEARAKHSEAVRQGNFDIYYGLTIWSPNINIFRDPRWGRGQETYGEDPFLTARMGVAFVSGLQGDDTKYLRVVSTPKHYAVHSGPEPDRHRFDVAVSPHDLQDTYLPAFRATVTEAHAQSVMCAYNAVDGAPACANPRLLQEVLRTAWKFDGFVTSDCGAVRDISGGHRFAPDLEHASVVAVRAGTDTTCGTEYTTLPKAVADGLIRESELDTAVERLLLARFRLGMFDPPGEVAYARLPFAEVDSAAHGQLALRAARASMVLLKNEGGVLPLARTVKTVAVIGPNAASLAALEGNYNAIPSHPVTPLDGLRTALAGRAKVVYAQGSSYVEPLSVAVPETVFSPGRGGARTGGGGAAGLRAEYFANAELKGAPAMVRTDRHIDFDWNAAKPGPAIPANAFSVRWSGTMAAPAAGDYTFTVRLAHCSPCGDTVGYAMYVDGKLAGERNPAGKASRTSLNPPFTVHFDDTKPHPVRIEYTHASPRFGGGITLEWMPPAAALREEAVRVAAAADVVVAFVGLSPNLEGEEMAIHVDGFAGGDRTDIQLPAVQEQLLEAVAATGKPLVVALLNGSAVAVNWAQQHAAAILEAWYPGQAGGTAIAETLLGGNNPAGRLPVTFYKSINQLPAFTDYSMANRTYRYSKAEPLYGFGDGLSYTTFAYSGAALSASRVAAGEPVTVTVRVANTGKVAGDEVVEAYLTASRLEAASELAGTPLRALVGFTRVHLAAGQSREVAIAIDSRQLSLVDAKGRRAIMAGSYVLHVGGRQPRAGEAGLGFEIAGTKELPE